MPKKPRAPKAKANAPALSGRNAVPALMKRAREIAVQGSAQTFNHACQLMGDGGVALKLWASADNRDEIDRLCLKAREPRRRR